MNKLFILMPLYNYFLFLKIDEGEGKVIDCSKPIRGQITSKDGKRSSIFLRYNEANELVQPIRIYPGGVR